MHTDGNLRATRNQLSLLGFSLSGQAEISACAEHLASVCASSKAPSVRAHSRKLYRLEGRQNPGRPNGKLRSLKMMPVDSEFSNL